MVKRVTVKEVLKQLDSLEGELRFLRLMILELDKTSKSGKVTVKECACQELPW